MKLRRVATAAVLVGTFMGGSALLAGAQSYETLDPGTVTDNTPAAGSSVTVEISGFKANSQVLLELHSNPVVLGTFLADAFGVVRATVTIPVGTVAGSHSIVASGVNPSGAPAAATIPVAVPAAVAPTTTTAPTGGSFLPRTGADIAAVVTIGGALVLVGGASAVAARRRLGHHRG